MSDSPQIPLTSNTSDNDISKDQVILRGRSYSSELGVEITNLNDSFLVPYHKLINSNES